MRSTKLQIKQQANLRTTSRKLSLLALRAPFSEGLGTSGHGRESGEVALADLSIGDALGAKVALDFRWPV